MKGSNDIFFDLLKNAPFGIFVVNSDLKLVEVSAGAKKTFKNIFPLNGRNLTEILQPMWKEPYLSEAVKLFRQTLETDKIYFAENNNQEKVNPFDWKIERVILPDESYGVICYFYNLTPPRINEDDENIYRQSNENDIHPMPSNIAVLDAQGRITAVNETWRKFAFENSENPNIYEKVGIGINYLEICRSARGKSCAEAEAAFQGIKDVLDGKRDSFSLEYPCHSPMEERWFLLNCTPLETTAKSAVVSHTEITSRRKTEKSLLYFQEKYQEIFEKNPFPMWVFDLKTLKFLEVNEAAVNSYGYSREEFLKMSLRDIHQKKDIPQMLDTIANAKMNMSNNGVWNYRKKDGTIIKAEIKTHLLDYNGSLARLAIVIDVTERLRTEEHLRLSEERYRLLFEDNPSPMIIYDFDTLKFLDVNEATCLHYGWTREEFLQMKLTDIAYLEDLENVKEQVVNNGNKRTFYGKWKHRKKDGTEIWVETASHKLKIEGENSRIVLINDVTETKKAEEELREAEQRFRATFEQAAVGIAHVAPDRKWSLVNEKLCEITGYTREELAERTFQEILHPDDAGNGWEPINDVLSGKINNYSREKRYVRKDGKVIWVSKTVSLARDFEGKPKYFISVIEDISQRKTAEAEMRQWADAFENCAHGIALGDPRTNKIIAVNAAFERLCGKPKSEIENYPILAVYDESVHETVKKSVVHADKTGSSQYEALIKRKDGSVFPVQMDIVSVRGESGDIIYRVATMQDISARKDAEENLRKSEEKLRQSQKMEAVGRLAGGIAHDFNNMLTVIKGYSDLSLRSLTKDDPIYRYVEEVKKAGDRSSLLTSQLLAFSRTQILQPEILNINQVIAETIKMLKYLIGEDINLVLHLEPEIGYIKADLGQISQVFINLLVNASDAMPNGGEITIKTREVLLQKEKLPQNLSGQEEKFICFEVCDTGTGMDEETLQNIFEPFFTTKVIGKGTGLGLSTVYGIIEQSGGFIDVKSNPGKGTVFEIYLPQFFEAYSAKDQSASFISLPGGKERILIVEDEELVRNLTAEALKVSGYEAVQARRASEAILLLERENYMFDLIITDIVMPEMSGYELFKEVSGKTSKLPKFLFTSGYLEDERIKNMSFDISEYFIQKPFQINELIIKIQEILAENP